MQLFWTIHTVLCIFTQICVYGYSISMTFKFIERPTLLVACFVNVKFLILLIGGVSQH